MLGSLIIHSLPVLQQKDLKFMSKKISNKSKHEAVVEHLVQGGYLMIGKRTPTPIAFSPSGFGSSVPAATSG